MVLICAIIVMAILIFELRRLGRSLKELHFKIDNPTLCAFENGAKIRPKTGTWKERGFYVHLVNGKVVDQEGLEFTGAGMPFTLEHWRGWEVAES